MKMNLSADFWIQANKIIINISHKYDHIWIKRKRIIDSQLLIMFIFKLVLSKNTQGYNSILVELWDELYQKGLKLPQKEIISQSSICEARQKLSENVFKELNKHLIKEWKKTNENLTWRGHRVFGVDGSKINLPCNLVNYGYKLVKAKNRHYPEGLISTLYNLREEIIYDFMLVNHRNERVCAIEHMNLLNPGDVMIFDRGYFSYELLYHCVAKGIFPVFRIQTGNINKEITCFLNSKKTDEIINYYPSASVKSELKKKGFKFEFKTIPLRLIKYVINKENYICATTLIRKNHPEQCFADLYHARWGIEELYKISKIFINVEDFHSSTERGIKQEIYAHFTLINIARFFSTGGLDNLNCPEREKFEIILKKK